MAEKRKEKEDRVLVHVRVRPLTTQEEGHHIVVESRSKHQLAIRRSMEDRADNGLRTFSFDRVYWSLDGGNQFDGQDDVYNHIGKLMLEHAFAGFNTCIFAYGQTGSGKTYTMMGDPHSHDDEGPGIIPRACDELFTLIDAKYTNIQALAPPQEGEEGAGGAPSAAAPIFSHEVFCSYYEIYNERVYDLLEPGKENLRVREHPTHGPYVENLHVSPVCMYEEVRALLLTGNKYRHTNATKINERSSRSHAIFTITLKQSQYSDGELTEFISKINLVDLAGSERTKNAGTTGDVFNEGVNINKSLCNLGTVIHSLAESNEKHKSMYINFRDSNLTWLLRENLGGNSKTIMVATVSPSHNNYDESLNTLRYANRVKQIRQKAVVNEDSTTRLIRDLRQEVAHLRRENMEIMRLKHELATMKLANRKLVDDTKKAAAAAAAPAAPQPAPVPAKAAATSTPHLLRARGVPYLVVLRPNPPAGAPVVAEIPRGGLYITDDADAAVLSHDALHGLVAAHPCGGALPRGRDAANGADVLRIAGAGRSSALVAKGQQSSKSVFEKTRPCELLTLDAECTVLDTSATVKKQASYALFHGCFLQIGKAVLRFVDPAAADAAADRVLHLEPATSAGALPFAPPTGGRVYTLAEQAQIVETLTEDQKALFHALSPEEQQAFLAAQPTPKEYAALPDENKRALEEARSEQLRLSAASPTAAAAAAAAAAGNGGGQPKLTLLEQLAAYETLSAEDKKMFDELSPGAQRAFLTVQQASGSADATALLHLLHREERGGGGAGGKEGGVLRGAGSGTTTAAADAASKLTLEEERALYNKLSAEEREVFDGFSAARQQQFFQDVLAGERAAEVLTKLAGETRDDDALTLKEKQRIVDSLNPEERALFDSLEAREQELFLEHARELTGGLTEGRDGDGDAPAAEDLQEREARVAAVRRRILEDLAGGTATEASVAREVSDLRKALSLKPYEAQLSTSRKAETAAAAAAASGLTVSEQLSLVAGLTQEQQERFHSLDATRQQEVLQALAAGSPAGSPHAEGGATAATTAAADVDALLEAAESAQRADGAPAPGAGAKTLKERLEIFSSCLSEEMKQRFEELPAAAQLAFMQAHPLREDYDGLSAEEKRDIESQKEQTMQALQAASHLLGADGAAAAPSEAASVAALSGELHTLKGSEKRLQERVRESEMLIEKIHDERAAEKVMMNLKVEEAQCEIVAKEAVIDEVRKQLFAEREQYEKKLQEVDNRAKAVHEDQQRKDALNEECVRVLEFQFSEATNRHRSDRDEKEKIIADLESRLSATRAVLESERHEAAGAKIHSSLLEEKLSNVESSLKSTVAAHTALADELSSSKSHISSLEEVCDESKRKVADLNKENASRSDEAEARTREIFDLREKERELSIAVEQQKTISKDELLRKQKELDHMKELTEQGEIAKAAVESQCAMLRDRVSTSLEDIQRLKEEIVGVEKEIKEKETTLDVIQVEKAQLSEQHTKEVEDHRRERAKQISEHQQTIRALNEQLVSIQQQARDVQEKNRDLYQAQEKIRSRRTALKSELDRKEDELRDTKKKYVEAHSRLQTSIKRGNSDRKHLDSLRRLTSVVKEQEVRISYLQRELRENQAWTRRLEEGNASSYTSAQVHEVRQDVQTVLTQLKAEVVQFTPVTLRQLQTMANFITASHDPRRIFRQAFNHIRHVVGEICGRDLPLDGSDWGVEESNLGKMKPYQRASVLKALREIVVWYGVSPDYTRQEMTNFLDLVRNARFIVTLAVFCQSPSMPDFSSRGKDKLWVLAERKSRSTGEKAAAASTAITRSRSGGSPPPPEHRGTSPPHAGGGGGGGSGARKSPPVAHQATEQQAAPPVPIINILASRHMLSMAQGRQQLLATPGAAPGATTPGAGGGGGGGGGDRRGGARESPPPSLPRPAYTTSALRSFSSDNVWAAGRQSSSAAGPTAKRNSTTDNNGRRSFSPSLSPSKPTFHDFQSVSRPSSASNLNTYARQDERLGLDGLAASGGGERRGHSPPGEHLAHGSPQFSPNHIPFHQVRSPTSPHLGEDGGLHTPLRRMVVPPPPKDDPSKKSFMQGTVSSQGKEVARTGFPLAAHLLKQKSVRYSGRQTKRAY